MRGRLGILRSARPLKPVAADDPLWYQTHLHGFYFEDTDMNVVFGSNGTGRVDYLQLGLVGSRFDRITSRSAGGEGDVDAHGRAADGTTQTEKTVR